MQRSEDIGFWEYMRDTWSYDPDMTPVKNVVPTFITAEGTFDVVAYEKWLEARRKEYASARG